LLTLFIFSLYHLLRYTVLMKFNIHRTKIILILAMMAASLVFTTACSSKVSLANKPKVLRILATPTPTPTPTPINPITLLSIENESITKTGFAVLINFSGDENDNVVAHLYFCNDSFITDCNPTEASNTFVAMTKSDSSTLSGTVADLTAPTAYPANRINYTVIITDTDGVITNIEQSGFINLEAILGDEISWDEAPEGDATGPIVYNIGTREQLISLATDGCSSASSVACDKNFALSSDVDFSGTETAPIGSFSGSFNGNGHTIANFTINKPTEQLVGLFSEISGTVENLHLDGANVSGESFVGILAGNAIGTSASSSAIIRSIVVTNSELNATGLYSGGVVGLAEYAIFENIICLAEIYAHSSSSGGIVGVAVNTSVEKSYFGGSIQGEGGYFGGIVGNAFNTIIKNCYSHANLSSSDGLVGGLVGQFNGTLSNSYSTGNITAPLYAGGLVGWMYSGTTILDSFSTGTISTCLSNCGGLVGYKSTTLTTITTSYRYTSAPVAESGIGTLNNNLDYYYDPNTFLTGFAWDTAVWEFTTGTGATFPELKNMPIQ